ncbi:MAG: lipopolysaccharide heptosyltransferase II [Gammaproteobacteria bacterium]|nr:lipopolysaccharide heptosyltransferase II [Gammaproteobacteria bacterium]MDH3767698.1 lipopolysaccharide heptosyltransferase II [Gammaproteobacteria bacterium]
MSHSVLIVGPSWIGDMVMAQSLCRTLRQRDPDVVIDILAPGWSLPVIARMNEIRAGIELPFTHGEFNWPGRHRLGKSLRDRAYDQAIVLPRSFKSSLVPFHAGIPLRTGYRGEMRFGLVNDMRELNKTRHPTTVARFAALGVAEAEALPDPLPQPRLRIDIENLQAVLDRLELSRPPKLLGMMPGAEYGPAKQWPVESFVQLAKLLNEQGVAVWVFGSDKDRVLGDRIAAATGADTVNLCGRTTLTDAIDLISLADNVVSNDSGLMHISAAAGARVIAIYGSSSPNFTPPLTDRSETLWLGIECSPCFERTCRFGHYRCLRDITAQTVHETIFPAG